MIWFGFTMISPFLAFVCWYAKGKSRPAFMLSVLILAVLFNMTFVYGWDISRHALFRIDSLYHRTYCSEEGHIEKFCANGNNWYSSCQFYLIWLFHFILDKQLPVSF